MDNENPQYVAFRPSLKRKTIRTRLADRDDEGTSDHDTDMIAHQKPRVAQSEGEVGENSMSRSRAGKLPRRGIVFGGDGRILRQESSLPSASDIQALATHKVSPPPNLPVSGRFVAGTGQAVSREDSEHMMAYVGSRLAESRQRSSISGTPSTADQPVYDRDRASTPRMGTTTSSRHLVEEIAVDYASNITTSKDAVREDGIKARQMKPPKPRYGRNGKLLPPRKPRGYRDEDDKARDSLVDRILSENRVEGIYDTSDTMKQDRSSRGQDVNADRQMAEDFEREYRTNAQVQHAKSKPPTAKASEPSTGPKKGGSKNMASRK